MTTENRIISVHLEINSTGGWTITTTKEFEERYGGGTQQFTERATGGIHHALDVARGMVTLSPGARTDIPVAPEDRVAEFDPRKDRRG